MADYYCCKNMPQELDDDVHRLLPPEILGDIGIITNADELRSVAIVEELSSRLATVLSGVGAGVKGFHSQHHHRLPPAWATNSYQHQHQHRNRRPPQPQFYPMDSRRGVAEGHANAQTVHALHPLTNAGMVGMSIGISMPRFAPASPRRVVVVVPPPKQQCISRGTGVFLPRAQQVCPHTTASGARTPTSGGAGVKKPRQQQCRQQLRLHAHAVAAAHAMEQQPQQQQQARKRSDANVGAHGCHDELGLPLEWLY